MPAYRSAAEQELRAAVVDRLRVLRPKARIIHEICAELGGSRIDVLAVSPDDIIAAEIKSKKDKLERLPTQVQDMRAVAHVCVAAIHEKFLVEVETNAFAAHRERRGVFYADNAPSEAAAAHRVWAYPHRQRALTPERNRWDALSKWDLPDAAIQETLPGSALNILWADELRWLCSELGITVANRPSKGLMRRALRWQATGREITRGVCEALRRRVCIEADPPIKADWRN